MLSVSVVAQYAAPPSGEQSVCPLTQLEPQTPPEQTCCPPQAWPHEPQLLLSVSVVAQYAAPPSGEQSDSPLTQLEPQTPPEQTLLRAAGVAARAAVAVVGTRGGAVGGAAVG